MSLAAELFQTAAWESLQRCPVPKGENKERRNVMQKNL